MPDRGILAPHLPTLDGHGLVQAVDFDANPHGLANRPEHEEPEASDRIVSRKEDPDAHEVGRTVERMHPDRIRTCTLAVDQDNRVHVHHEPEEEREERSEQRHAEGGVLGAEAVREVAQLKLDPLRITRENAFDKVHYALLAIVGLRQLPGSH